MAERENLFITIKYKFEKIKYFFYGEKFFKKKDMIGPNILLDLK